MTTLNTARGRGHPTSYREVYNNEVIETLAKGHSITAFAGEIGVNRTTVFDWMKAHPEFKSACEKAACKAVLYWEKQLIACAETGKGNVTAIIFGLKNRAHEDWRDVHKLEHTGKDGAAIEVANLSTADRARAVVALLSKAKPEITPTLN